MNKELYNKIENIYRERQNFLREVIAAIDVIDPIIKSMDGKIYNKTFKEKLNKCEKNVKCNKISYAKAPNDYNLEIESSKEYIKERYVYPRRDSMSLLNDYKNENNFFNETDTGKFRINYKNMHASLEERKLMCEYEIEDIDRVIGKLESTLNEIENIIQKIDNLYTEIGGFHYILQEYDFLDKLKSFRH